MAAYLSHSAGSCAILTRAAIGCLTVEFLFTFILLQGCRGSSRSHRAMRWCRISSRWIGVLAAVGAHTGIPSRYGGLFTILEAAAVGCIFAALFAVFRGRMNAEVLWKELSETAATTGLIYIIIFGATIFTVFISLTQMPGVLVTWIKDAGIPPGMVIFLLLVMYIILGSIFETVAAMIITLPVVFPLVVGLGFDPIWWGIINIMVIEIGQTTPPIGIIPFVLHGMRPDISLKTIFIGIVPFFFADLTRLGIIAAFPALALWLPDRLGMLLN
ncbi:MAG: TRAP transporter large permease subunit [Pseudomonadota bacterium]|nr:TRAP transporter large permease subunit [Pseudomonadota bacterium]